MLSFEVTGMTCGHCEAAVTRAVHSVDPAAKVIVDRAANQVTVDGSAEPEAVQCAVEAEGYGVTRSA